MTSIGYRKAIRMDHQIGFRVYKTDYEQLEQIAAARQTTVTELCRLKVAEILDEEPSGVLGQINARLERFEQMLQQFERIVLNLPSENASQGASDESQVYLHPQESPYLLSEWVNADALIVCPHCGSLDSDWAEEYPEDAEVKAIVCHQCRTQSSFDMTR
jgi:hypothetical protein